MSELAPGFRGLPPEYQRVIQLAQDQHQISVVPLQELSGGWSGALIYLVSVAAGAPSAGAPLAHFILKLDRKGKAARSDEVSRHADVQSKSPAQFARDHLADLAYDRVEADGAIAIFYTIAGQSLQSFRPLSSYNQQHQLEILFAATNHYLLDEWNTGLTFAQALYPQALLARWLGFRLDPGSPSERFIRDVCRANPDRPGFLLQSNVFPNPLWYARHAESWGSPRPIDALVGLQHGDLNTNNILVKFSADGQDLTGYYLIDFALYKDQMPLVYDQRYLEMSYLILTMAQTSLAKTVDLILRLAEGDNLDPRRAPIEMAGASAVISTARGTFDRWVREHHPSLHDDLWGQYWLAGVAAGLAYCHKAGQADEQRLAGLIYAAANLKRYAAAFRMPLPTDVQPLYDPDRFAAGASGGAASAQPLYNLPVPPTPFLGRAAHVAAIKALLPRPEMRLVTLTGPGGTGKTRLSIQAAHAAADQFEDGAVFVSLADDADHDQLVTRLAQSLDVRQGGSRPLLDNVKDFLRDKQLLLILDNFEQLLASPGGASDNAAGVVADLLTAAPRLKILVSSRIPLNLRGEHEYPVPPLELPPAAAAITAAELASNESVALFSQRARAAQPAFELTDDNAGAVAEICRHLDGLPLALELAAARVKLLPPQAILSRLDDRLKLLTGGARDLPARHQTLRNTIEWSYGLLNPAEKRLYAQLGVFVGGFTLEAAEAVCQSQGELDVLDGLASLVNNSLLRQQDSGGEARFVMLETIRAFAVERLIESGDLAALQEKHARYFAGVINKQAGPQLYTANATYWLNWLEREHDNIRAMLVWSQTAPRGAEFAAPVVQGLNWFWYRRGYFSEGRAWAVRILETPAGSSPGPTRGLALMAAGLLAMWQGEQATALEQTSESLAIWQRLEDEPRMAMLLLGTSLVYINMGRDGAAQPRLEAALAIFKELKFTYFHALAQVHEANALLGLGKLEQAQALLDRGLAEARAIDEDWVMAFALTNLGEVARTRGQFAQARTYYEEAETRLRRSGDQGDLARLVYALGCVALHEDDAGRAEAQFRESMAMFRRLGSRRGLAECLAGLAGLWVRQAQARPAATLLAAAETLLQANGSAWWPADRVEVEANRDRIRTALDETTFAAAWDQGRIMTLDQALHFVESGVRSAA